MINLSGCIELGELLKPHGVKGQLVLKLNNLSFDDIKETEQVFILIDGLPVPFFIEELQERTNDSLILKFEDVSSENTAREICNCLVFIDKKFVAGNRLTVLTISDLIGFSVKDKEATEIGMLESVLDIENNPLLRIVNNKKEILLPLNPEFIVSYDLTKKEIIVNFPEGLLELYS
jgi:16S rRNA processing protein RimM